MKQLLNHRSTTVQGLDPQGPNAQQLFNRNRKHTTKKIMKKHNDIHRRSFLKLTGLASGGLMIGFNFLSACNAPMEKVVAKALPKNWYDLNAFLKIGETGLVTIFSPNPEIGQNVKTSMPMIVAEELGIAWRDVVVEQAPLSVDFDRQVAGGSQSLRSSWKGLREAGATARQMLISAAAKQWNVDASTLTTKEGVITNANGASIGYGDVAQAASALEVPTEVTLKDPKDFTIIGTSQPNVDMNGIITGASLFGIDTKVEGMVYAMAMRPPAFGSTLKSFDDNEARKVNGVIDIIQFAENKIAVLANSTWAAMKAKKLLKVDWKAGQSESTADHDRELMRLLDVRMKEPRRNDGDVDKAFAEADWVHEKVFEAPFLPHNCMEPMNFFAKVADGKAELTGPIQTPKWTQTRVAELLKIEPEAVTIMMTRMGGGFGRRLYGDFALEAAEVAQKTGKPIQMIFSRDDDMAAGTYRPASKYKLRAAVKGGEITGYHMTEACVARNMYDNIVNFFPAGSIDNLRIDTNNMESNISTGAWRAPYTNFLGFAEQSFFDELAKKMEKDPVAFRLALYEKAKGKAEERGYEWDPEKAIAVTKLAAEKAGWGTRGDNVFQGFSMYYSHNTHVAEVADVVIKNGQPIIEKVTCAIHCGIVVNPMAAKNQVEGGIIDGIGHALFGDFSFDKGIPSSSNFDKFRMIRMDEAPEIEVHFVKSLEDPTGLGEPSLPPAGGAIANAFYKANGTRFYKQPFSPGTKES